MNANCTMLVKQEIFGFKDFVAYVSLLKLMIVLNNIKMMWSVSSLVAFNFDCKCSGSTVQLYYLHGCLDQG